jgi:hypothetical protein
MVINARVIREEFDLPVESVVEKIAPLSRLGKREFVQAFMCELNLHVRGEQSLEKLQAVIEIYHRCFEQMNAYLRPECEWDSDECFVKTVFGVASRGGVEGEMKGAMRYAMDQLKSERVMN